MQLEYEAAMRALQDDVYKYMQMQKQQGAEYSSGMQQQAQKRDIKKNDGSAMPLWVQGLTEIGSIGVGKRTVFLYGFVLAEA